MEKQKLPLVDGTWKRKTVSQVNPNDKYFFISAIWKDLPDNLEPVVAYVHPDEAGYFISTNAKGLAVFKGEDLAKTMALDLGRQNPKYLFSVHQLKIS